MSSCKEIGPLLGRYIDHELEPADVNRVDNHLSVCERCAEEVRALEREAELLRRALAVDEVPAALGVGLWKRLQAARPQPVRYFWYGLAAAAAVLVALVGGLVTRPSATRAPIARVTTCSGPLELRAAGEQWAPVATYAVLRDGDRVRCGTDRPGALILNSNRRFDFDTGAELAFHYDGAYGQFRVEMQRGRIRGDLTDLRRQLSITTPVADITAMAEGTNALGHAEFEVCLSGVAADLGLLERLHLLPAAYAGMELPRLEVKVYEGSVILVNQSNSGTAVTPGRRVVVDARGPIPEPERFDPAAERAWWTMLDRVVAVTKRYEPPTAPPTVEVAHEPKPPSPPPDHKIFDPVPEPPGPTPTPEPVRVPKPGPPAVTPPVEGPPRPEGLSATPDIDSVVLTWKPVVSEKRPVVEYGVYRRALGDTNFALIARLPASGQDRACRFTDEGLSLGAEYQYAVAAAWRDDIGAVIDGQMAQPVTGCPADFRISYRGGDDESLVNVRVEKLHDGTIRAHTFPVRKRDLASDETGDIGGPKLIEIEPIRGARYRQLIDFSTGYHLVDIVSKTDYEKGIPRKRSKIIIENDVGVRRDIDLLRPAGK